MLGKGKGDSPFKSLRLTIVIIGYQINTITAVLQNAFLFILNYREGIIKTRVYFQTLFQVHSEGLDEEGLFDKSWLCSLWLLSKNGVCRKQVRESSIG